jgi:DNA polymerase-3 subunit gamma/tau
MSYLVLARKYRPRSFEELVGQEHVVQALANALVQGRLHHAYLFTGTRGVGKTTVSRILAKSLNCVGADGSGGITAHPCGVCHACRDIDSGRFVDYVELDAASNRGVEEISLLLDQAVYKPVVGRFKVYMIDEVHMLSNTAFNAMLKTLEEPPEYLKFVLATTDPQKVPPTVLSRCLQFNLRPMAPQTVQQHLAHVLADEGVAAEAGALRLLARAAHGSMRDGLSLTDQAIAFGAGAITEGEVRQMLGAVDRGHAVRVIDALAASDGASLVAAADALRGLGLSAAGTLEELADLLQQMALAQAVPGALDADDPGAATIARLASLLPADEVQLIYSMALHGRAELGLAPDEYSGLVMVLLRMLAFRPPARGDAASVPPRGDVSVAPATSTVAASPAAVAPVVAAPAVAVAAPSAQCGNRWTQVVEQLIQQGSITALVRELAMQSQCLSMASEGGHAVWRLRVERETLRAAAQRDKLQATLVQLLGGPLRLELEAGVPDDSPALRASAERERRQRAAEQIIHNDPLVQALMSQYKTARIVPGSVKPH